jgi:hypothetical protein
MKALNCVSRRIALALLVVAGAASWRPTYAGGESLVGNQYVIIGSVYLDGAYENLNDRRVSRDAARAYISSVPVGKRVWMAFECQIPIGTAMLFLGSAPKVWRLPFMADRYFVRLTPDISRGLDVVIALDGGLDGSLDGLNPALFARYPSDGTLPLPAVPLTIAPCQPVEVPAPESGEGRR